MLISKSHKFLYYHLYKVAGTSIRNVLIPYCSKKQVIAQNINHACSIFGIKLKIPPIYNFHPDLTNVKNYLGEEFNDYYRFTFVRNPLDWQKSIYFFTKKNTRHHQHSIVKKMSFEEYIYWRINEDMKLASDLLFHDGDCLVNDIYRYEDITSEFKRLCKKINISTELPHKNIAGHNKKITISNKAIEDFIEAFKKDYEVFGYDPSSYTPFIDTK